MKTVNRILGVTLLAVPIAILLSAMTLEYRAAIVAILLLIGMGTLGLGLIFGW